MLWCFWSEDYNSSNVTGCGSALCACRTDGGFVHAEICTCISEGCGVGIGTINV